MNTLKCARCGFLSPKAPVCLLSGLKVDAAKDSCSKSSKNIQYCEICSNAIFPGAEIISMKDDLVKIICPDCASSLNTCRLCVHSTSCAFETDPSSIPKYIEEKIRQGNIIQIKTVKNPERIEKLCKAKCPCFSEENECSRQFNTCGKCESV